MSVDSAVLRDLFRRAADLSATDRDHFLSTLNEETRSALNALLESDREAEVFFERILDDAQPPLSKAGQRFGPYEIRELIGQGGMGAVFRAERVDGEFRQVVALKIIERAWLNPRVADRFRQEREFLAGLVHANIAHLIDGGTRADGIPYLAMEYVEGVPLDVYCKEHRLTIAERLRLFLPLCDAVDSAHQRLIVHRDLKPSNVLVTSTGEPKLLDFGIAKALDAGGDSTHTLVFTPDFASPEQARGEAATTATDVYGLGAVLYFMLVGRAPHTVTATSPAEINKQIAETVLARPSSIVPELKGDLDNILLKSLHRDPLRRYRSAREFAQDVGRHLGHRPVLATPDSFSYRTRRFLQRHTIASLAAGLAIVATVSGTAAALYQARRAERRFAQVRTLSNRFVFDFEAAIRDLPGSLAARRMVASTAREYLTSLAEDAKHDPSLNGELAEAYYRLSRVESSMGESAQATDHLRKTIDLLKYSKSDCCGTPAQRSRYIFATADLARFEDDSGRMETHLCSPLKLFAPPGPGSYSPLPAKSPREASPPRS
jgi:eukaryotic-like serine/threonine-protein kinase